MPNHIEISPDYQLSEKPILLTVHWRTIETVVYRRHGASHDHQGDSGIVQSREFLTVVQTVVFHEMKEGGEPKTAGCPKNVKKEREFRDVLLDLLGIAHDRS